MIVQLENNKHVLLHKVSAQEQMKPVQEDPGQDALPQHTQHIIQVMNPQNQLVMIV